MRKIKKAREISKLISFEPEGFDLNFLVKMTFMMAIFVSHKKHRFYNQPIDVLF